MKNIKIRSGQDTSLKKRFKVSLPLYVMLLPAIIYIIVFCYAPIYGIQIAFKDFNPSLGITKSAWIGFDHFVRFFTMPQFTTLLKNTLGISLYQLIVSFPLPIALALMLNYAVSGKFKKILQTVTYSSHFISVVVLVGMLNIILSPRTGIVNYILQAFGADAVNFMSEASMFSSIYVWSGVWQNLGWGSILYIAALSGVNTELYEAADIDGANKLQKMLNIDLPVLIPTAVTMLILNSGNLMSLGFEKIYLMQNPLNTISSEVISTYVYKSGLLNFQYSFSAAVGLFNNIINVTILLVVNRIAKKLTDISL